MSKRDENIIALRVKVRNLLLSLDPKDYPGIYSILNNPEGYLQMEDMLLNYAATNQISLSAAVAQLEMELA